MEKPLIQGNRGSYQPNITRNANGHFYALVVRIDHDGAQHVCRGFKGRHFVSRIAAEKAAAAYIEKNGLNSPAAPAYRAKDQVVRETAPLGVVQ